MKLHKLIATIILSQSPFIYADEIKPLEIDTGLRSEVSSGFAYLKGKELVAELLKKGYTTEDFSLDGFTQGFTEAMAKKDSSVKMADFQVARNLMNAKLQERELSLAKSNLEISTQWMLENSKKEGINTTKSGLQYEVIKKAEGEVTTFNTADQSEAEQKRFFISYASANTNGVVFEASAKGKLVGLVETPLKGLSEALSIMPVGSHWKLYIKPELGYGGKRVGAAMEPNSILVMNVLLAAVKPVEEKK